MRKKPWEAGPLHVTSDGRYLAHGSEPFFLLADTAWLLMGNLEEDDIRLYLKNRRDLGFSAIQCVYGYTREGERDSSLSQARHTINAAYDALCRETAVTACEMGLYLAVLPSWGSLVKDGYLNAENMESYLEHVCGVYAGLPNLIWVLGGDIMPEGYEEVYRKAGRFLKTRTPDRLITFHPFGRTSSSAWFQGESWLDFNMFQSGHRRYDQRKLGAWDDHPIGTDTVFFGEDNYRYVQRDLSLMPRKPTMDGEPSYEAILQGLHDPTQPYWQAEDARRYAWWSVLSGSCGHTYGHCSVQQMCLDPAKGKYGVRESWEKAIHAEGAGQMQVLKKVCEAIGWQEGQSAQERLIQGGGEKYAHIPVFAGDDFVLAYDYSGEVFVLDVDSLSPFNAWLINPESGAKSCFAMDTAASFLQCSPPKRKGSTDWAVLVRKCRHKEGESHVKICDQKS